MRRRRWGGSENFYVSLNDMLVGILFIFILLLAWSAVDYNRRLTKSEQLAGEHQERLEKRQQLLEELEAELQRGNYRAKAYPKDGILRFDEELLFEQGQSELKPQGRRALAIMGDFLKRRLPCDFAMVAPGNANCGRDKPILEAIYVEGHTDSTRYRNDPDGNFKLSSLRAIATLNAMTAAAPELRELANHRAERLIGVSGYADTRPLPETLASNPKNRRVDFRFIMAPPIEWSEAARQ